MRKDARFELRIAPAELAAWQDAAASVGATVSEFVRGRVNVYVEAAVEPVSRPTVWGGDGWQDSFLEALACGYSVAAASRTAGVSRTTVYAQRSASPEFAIGWELACEAAEADLCDGLVEHAPSFSGPDGEAGPLALAGPIAPRAGRAQTRLEVRVSDEELVRWRSAAATAGTSVAGLVRRLVRGELRNPRQRELRSRSWRPLFVAGLRQTGRVAAACRVAGISRTLAYRSRAQSQAFALAWEAAQPVAEERLMLALWQAGVEGIPVKRTRTTTQRDGSVVTVTTEYRKPSDRAAMKLLRRFGAEPYRHGQASSFPG